MVKFICINLNYWYEGYKKYYVLNKHETLFNLHLQINDNFTLDVDWSIQIVITQI